MGKLSLPKATKALREHSGVILRAAEACGVSRTAFYNFMEKHPELAEVKRELDEELLDIGEANVVTNLKAGDGKTTRWFLERKGKDRGYTTRQEQTGADGAPLEHHVVERRITDPSEK